MDGFLVVSESRAAREGGKERRVQVFKIQASVERSECGVPLVIRIPVVAGLEVGVTSGGDSRCVGVFGRVPGAGCLLCRCSHREFEDGLCVWSKERDRRCKRGVGV